MSKSYDFDKDFADDSEKEVEAEEVVETPAPVAKAPKSDGVSVRRLKSGQITNK